MMNLLGTILPVEDLAARAALAQRKEERSDRKHRAFIVTSEGGRDDRRLAAVVIYFAEQVRRACNQEAPSSIAHGG
jgi:chemotaxis signal transduction protein